ncbi:cell division protein FtsQ [Acetitomaculum ruminis DSM 5522]|uniref:Cell division protein FtsQ n=1 Tax=Acetitomaculum ruminis DSM 5522 TaxID=1120918 RepID=A0A1I0VVD6_9FIRM|nr:FtsQ-type POTRA domain-containing protein [Acetitomaculum ruminis]SFA80108.1 cell division protein FtsQ [Acetitomaculum ruminis DSM 5522]
MKTGNKKTIVFLAVIVLSLTVLVLSALLIFNVKKVTIKGNERYSKEEIKELLLKNIPLENTIFVWYKYKIAKNINIPFMDAVEMNIISPSEIEFTVYEKKVLGYVECLGVKMYFDTDGIVVESTTASKDIAPKISGLVFDHVLMDEKIPVEDEDVFNCILDVTKMLDKYKLSPDKIDFKSLSNIKLKFKDAVVYLGADKYLKEKCSNLSAIVQEISSKSGILHMENFDGNDDSISFEIKNKN